MRKRNHWVREKYSVLLVCTANICRSPIAEILLKAFIKSQGQSEAEWRIESAGVFASPGHPATTFAQEAVAELGFNLSGHKSQMVTKDLVKSFQLVLTMEKMHRQSILQLSLDIPDRVIMLSQVVGIEQDIDDPFGFSKNDYRNILRIIQSYFEQGWNNILRLAKE